ERGIHMLFQPPVGIGDFDPDFPPAGIRIDIRVDEVDLSSECLAGIGGDGNLHRLSDLDQAQILLEHLGNDPYSREIGDLEQRLAGHDAHAFDDLFFHDLPRYRRVQHQPSLHRPAAAQSLDLVVGNVPVFEPLRSTFDQPVGGGDLICCIGCLRGLEAMNGHQVLLLCQQQIRTVNLQYGGAAPDRLPGGVEMQPLDPTFDFRGDRGHATLIECDSADCVDGPHETVAALGRRRDDAETLHFLETDLDRRAVV